MGHRKGTTEFTKQVGSKKKPSGKKRGKAQTKEQPKVSRAQSRPWRRVGGESSTAQPGFTGHKRPEHGPERG